MKRGEFHLVYDISGSYEDDLVNLKAFAPTLFADLEKEFPGSRLSIGTFSDKYYQLFGGKRDICYQTHLGMTNDASQCVNTINGIKIQWGGDTPESQLDALYHGVMDPAVGWSDWKYDDPSNPVARVLILATDAVYHKPGDTTLPPHDGSPTPKCRQLDYASVDQIRAALSEKKVTPLFLITNVQDHYKSLLAHLDVGGSVQSLSSDSSNVINAIKSGLADILCTTTTTTTSTTTSTITSTITSTTSSTITSTITSTTSSTITSTITSTTTSTTTTGGGGGIGVVVGSAFGGFAALAAAAGGGLYAYQQYAAAQPADDDFDNEGDLEQEGRDVAADVDMSAFA